LWPNIIFLPSIVAEKNATKKGHIQNVCSMCIKINKVGKQEVGIWWVIYLFIPPLPRRGGVYRFTSVCLSVLPSVPISREAFLDPSNSYFLFADFVDFYTHWTYMLIFSSHFSKCPKTPPTIWYTYMMLVTKYQISAINSYWEKCDEKYLGRTDRRLHNFLLINKYTILKKSSHSISIVNCWSNNSDNVILIKANIN
jgi:hypothetical protein